LLKNIKLERIQLPSSIEEKIDNEVKENGRKLNAKINNSE